MNGAIVFGANASEDLGIGDVIATSVVDNIDGNIVTGIQRKFRAACGLGQVGILCEEQMHFIDSRIDGEDAMSVASNSAKKNCGVVRACNRLA